VLNRLISLRKFDEKWVPNIEAEEYLVLASVIIARARNLTGCRPKAENFYGAWRLQMKQTEKNYTAHGPDCTELNPQSLVAAFSELTGI
jgi:hypothetical protein